VLNSLFWEERKNKKKNKNRKTKIYLGISSP